MLKRNAKNMPDGFEPPVPAWAGDWTDGVEQLTSAFFGVQGEETPQWRQWVERALLGNAADGPALVEKASFIDAAGAPNHVYLAYWRNGRYRAWWQHDDVSGWWSAEERANEGAGYWRETSTVAPDRIETLHSSPNSHGIATLASELQGPVPEHGYAGAARDRIPASGGDALRGDEATPHSLQAQVAADGKRVRIVAPKNMCIIRSGQDWDHCEAEERDFYLTQVAPSLQAGMDYLRDNPEESRCLCMRLMRRTNDDNGELNQTFGLGYGLDIYAFEEWAKSHPTHTKIFGQFLNHAEKFGENMKLRLWHEVSVVADEGTDFEYIACHSQTGLLPYANA